MSNKSDTQSDKIATLRVYHVLHALLLDFRNYY